MAAPLALLWDESLVGLQGSAARGVLRWERHFELTWPDGVGPDQRPAEAGDWLKRELAQQDVDAKSCIVVLPRGGVVLRRLDLPSAPDEELPDLVKFQAATVSSAPLERLLLDYFPMSTAAEAGDAGRPVLAATVFRDRVESIRATLAAAGCELTSVVLAPAATAEWIARLESQRGDNRAETSLIATRDGARLDVVVTRGGRVVLAQSSELHDDARDPSAARVLAELARMLVSLEAHGGSAHIDRVWTLGFSTELRSALAQRLGCSVRAAEFAAGGPAVPPTDDNIPATRFAPLVGALLGSEQRAIDAIDFLNPRRPPVQRDRTRERWLIAAAAVVLALALGWWFRSATLSNLERGLAALKKRDEGLTEVIKRSQPTVAAVAQLDDWEKRGRDWLDVYAQVEQLSPGTGSLYLSEVRAIPMNGAAVARLRLTGYARQRDVAERFAQKLAENKAVYSVDRLDLRYSAKDAEYPSWFEIYVDLLMPPTSK